MAFQQTDNWLGKWSGESSEGIQYSLQVDDKYRGMNLCEVHAEGIQTFYELECWATGSPSLLKVYYRSTKDGAFYAGDRIKLDQPLLFLKREKGKTIWQWRQVLTGQLRVSKNR